MNDSHGEILLALIFYGGVAWVALTVIGVTDDLMNVLITAAPKLLQIGLAAVGGSIVRKLARAAINRQFGLGVPV